ncbi:MAG: hypothetical protein ACI8SR_002754 [Oceanicoccus sp.]|jgi:uncharacterized protein (DUF1330 family)
MINILVILDVKNFENLTRFEHKAAEIMRDYGGDIVNAFETSRCENGTGQEVHLLSFPSEQAFAEYRTDSRLKEYAELRDSAIISTTVMTSCMLKNYN